jgi:hypothetical protein
MERLPGERPNPSVTTGQTGRGRGAAEPTPHPVSRGGAACRGEAAPRPYFHVPDLHVIDGLGRAFFALNGPVWYASLTRVPNEMAEVARP